VFSATYYYNKYRKRIPLEEVKAGQQITLTEKGGGETFNLEIGETGLSGAGLSGSKKLPVVLEY